MFKEVNVPDPLNARHPDFSERHRVSSVHQKISRHLIVAALAAATLVPATGCQTFRTLAVREAVMISYRDTVWARRAYNLRYGNCNRPYGDHFQNGFCAGYEDVCNGGDGYVPALPPNDYRGYQYQSSEGVQCVNAWFEGYPAGVSAARKEKVGNYNDILVSKMIDSAIDQEKNPKLPAAQKRATETVPQKPVATQPKPRNMLGMFPAQQQPATEMSQYEPQQMPANFNAANPAVTANMMTPDVSTDRVYSNSQPQPMLPPIVTGSGLASQTSNSMRPSVDQQPTTESNRRVR